MVNALAKHTDKPAACLDSRFWVWESLEEALRPELLSMPVDDFASTMRAFGANYKGSSDFNDMVEQRIYQEGDPLANEESK